MSEHTTGLAGERLQEFHVFNQIGSSALMHVIVMTILLIVVTITTSDQ